MAETSSRRAWVVTTVVGLTLLLVSAAVFAITTATARIAGDSRELHHLDETLRIAGEICQALAYRIGLTDSLECRPQLCDRLFVDQAARCADGRRL